jgi:hypothetical protein
MPRRTLLTLAQARALDAHLERSVADDSKDTLDADLAMAERLEEEDMHTSADGRAQLVRRAVALGVEVGNGDVNDQYVRLVYGY